MAKLHRYGRVLPERPVAYMDRLVCTAFAALVPRGFSRRDICFGTGNRVAALFTTALANHLLFHCNNLANRRDSDCKLRFPQLPCAFVRRTAAG